MQFFGFPFRPSWPAVSRVFAGYFFEYFGVRLGYFSFSHETWDPGRRGRFSSGFSIPRRVNVPIFEPVIPPRVPPSGTALPPSAPPAPPVVLE